MESVKWLSWMAKMTLAAIFFTVVSLYATWTVVQTYLDRLLAHYQIGGDMKTVGFSDFMANVGKDMNILNQSVSKGADKPVSGSGLASGSSVGKTGTPDNSTSKGTAAGGGTGAGGSTGTNGSGTAGGAGAGHGGSTAGDGTGGAGSGLTGREEKEGNNSGTTQGSGGMADALPVFGHSNAGSQSQSQQSGSGAEEKKTVVSSEHVSSTKDNMTNDDKMKLFSLLVSKLPPAEVQNISKLMEDGITQQELVEMNAIVQKYMSEDEYKQMVAILEKYQ
jgi:hypothetical protein